MMQGDPLNEAIFSLARSGIAVRRVDEPWLNLYNVQGVGELTRGQVIDLARQRSNSAGPALGTEA